MNIEHLSHRHWAWAQHAKNESPSFQLECIAASSCFINIFMPFIPTSITMINDYYTSTAQATLPITDNGKALLQLADPGTTWKRSATFAGSTSSTWCGGSCCSWTSFGSSYELGIWGVSMVAVMLQSMKMMTDMTRFGNVFPAITR